MTYKLSTLFKIVSIVLNVVQSDEESKEPKLWKKFPEAPQDHVLKPNLNLDGLPPERLNLIQDRNFDCLHLLAACSSYDCYALSFGVWKYDEKSAFKLKEHFPPTYRLPTESIYDSDGELKMQISGIGIRSNDEVAGELVCMSPGFFINSNPPGALIKLTKGGYTFARMTKLSDDLNEDRFQVEVPELPNHSDDDICIKLLSTQDKDIALLKALRMENWIEFPYLITTIDESFKELGECSDGGQIAGKQCDEVVCSTRGGYERLERPTPTATELFFRADLRAKHDRQHTEETAAIVRCDGQYYVHPIYYHEYHKRWCLSHLTTHANSHDEKTVTLKQVLRDQIIHGDADEITRKIDRIHEHVFDPIVRSIKFWNDVVEYIQYKYPADFQELQKNHQLEWKEFVDLDSRQQEQLMPLRECGMKESGNSCTGMKVTPWDLLQIIIENKRLEADRAAEKNVDPNDPHLGEAVIRSQADASNVENEKQEAVEENREEKAEEEAEAEEENELKQKSLDKQKEGGRETLIESFVDAITGKSDSSLGKKNYSYIKTATLILSFVMIIITTYFSIYVTWKSFQ